MLDRVARGRSRKFRETRSGPWSGRLLERVLSRFASRTLQLIPKNWSIAGGLDKNGRFVHFGLSNVDWNVSYYVKYVEQAVSASRQFF